MSDHDDASLINVAGIKQRMEDPEFLKEILEVFHQSYPASLELLEEAIQSADCKSIERHAHSLKGELMNFFTGRIIQLAYTLELEGRNQAVEDARETFRAFKRELEELQPLIKELSELEW